AAALFAGMPTAGLQRLQIDDQVPDHSADRPLVMGLSVKAPSPYWHVAWTMSLNLSTAIDEASDLIFGQRISKAIRKQAQVRGWSAKCPCYRAVAFAC